MSDPRFCGDPRCDCMEGAEPRPAVTDSVKPTLTREELDRIEQEIDQLVKDESVEDAANALDGIARRLLATAKAGMEDRERAIKAQDRCDALELELVDLRLDRQRLDWLDAYGWYNGSMGVGSAREFIDATFSGTQSSGRAPSGGSE
jgi:hypothetical protein